MNPGLYPDYSSTIQASVKVPVQFVAGTSGAVPALSAFAYRQGIKSVTKTGTGTYVIVPVAGCAGFVGMSENIIQASYSATGACKAVITANSLTSKTAPSVTITTVKSDGTAVDLASGDTLCLTFELQWQKPL